MEPRKHDAHTGGPSAGREDVEDHEAHLEEERTWSDAGVKIAACNLSEKVSDTATPRSDGRNTAELCTIYRNQPTVSYIAARRNLNCSALGSLVPQRARFL
jgi:hypothetical protein